MKRNDFVSVVLSVLSIFIIPNNVFSQDNAVRVEAFSPQGPVKGVRQVSARFSSQMVAFGDPRLSEPFDVTCPEKGRGRWADGKNWIYDFDREIPAGVICGFRVKPDLKGMAGEPIAGQHEFSFSTGGPSIQSSYPGEGSRNIDEGQVFILSPDAEATEESVLSNVSCSVEGINERIGIRNFQGGDTAR